MRIDRLETHDRYQHFTKQSFQIQECCDHLIKNSPFGTHPFYIFAHTRTDDDGVTKRLIWQPRLTKPEAQTNSMLFKAYPGTDLIKIIWMIPDFAMWSQFLKGNICDNETIVQSILDYQSNKDLLSAREPDDLADEVIKKIYEEISQEARAACEASPKASPRAALLE